MNTRRGKRVSKSHPGDRSSPDTPNNSAPIQGNGQALYDSTGTKFWIHLDEVTRDHGRVVAVGWTTAPALDAVLVHGSESHPVEIERHERIDVSEALELPLDTKLGFSILSDALQKDTRIQLAIAVPGGPETLTGELTETSVLSDVRRSLVPGLNNPTFAQLRSLPVGDQRWRELLDKFPVADNHPDDHLAYIEGAMISPEGDGVVYGWALHPPDALVWFEDEQGNMRSISHAFRRRRRDIIDSFTKNPWSDQESAFVIYLPNLSERSVVTMKVVTGQGVATLAQNAGGEMLPRDPRAAADKLFSIETEEGMFYRRVSIVDWPILAPLIRRRSTDAASLPVSRKDFGPLPEAPDTSIIVPLYRRFDFMEHQLLEFRRDREIRGSCELIYVIDDPLIEADILRAADKLYRLLGLPFTVILSSRNRGYSGANNLGAEHARGGTLLFLNSDVIPQQPGWLGSMRALLDADPSVGVVGPRLLFAHGGLQHAGMSFERIDTLGIWINRHPNAGLAPELDPAAEPVEVPAVTGACLLIRRKVFDEMGGWDAGYLIGDFEDSDLCLMARKHGYRVVYQPDSQLTHLERQSFSAIGQDHFKLRVTITNAVRHQERWRDMLSESVISSGIAEPLRRDTTK